MEYLDAIFCYIMSLFGHDVGASCSGARTFLECEGLAFWCWAFDRNPHWLIFAFAAMVALIANVTRCSLLLSWMDAGWPYFQEMHDYGGTVIVGAAMWSIALFKPRKK